MCRYRILGGTEPFNGISKKSRQVKIKGVRDTLFWKNNCRIGKNIAPADESAERG